MDMEEITKARCDFVLCVKKAAQGYRNIYSISLNFRKSEKSKIWCSYPLIFVETLFLPFGWVYALAGLSADAGFIYGPSHQHQHQRPPSIQIHSASRGVPSWNRVTVGTCSVFYRRKFNIWPSNGLKMKKAKQWQILNYALAYGRQQKANSDLKALASKIGDAPCVLSPPSRQQEEAEWWMF